MSENELQILQHSLGLDRYGQGSQYRNHYCVGAGCESFDDCQKLCADGLMADGGAKDIFGGMHSFSVTKKGIETVKQFSPKPPKLSRSALRYRQWLCSDSSFTFAEWIKMKVKPL